MKSFLKTILATFLGIVSSFILLFLLLIIISVASKKEMQLENNSVLHISLSETIYDRASNNPLDGLSPLSLNMDESIGLNTILNSIQNAKKDPKIKGIYLNIPSPTAGISTISEIRTALNDFKESGKFIISYAEWYTQIGYYLSSVSDTIYLNPMGNANLTGLLVNVIFFKKALEKIGVEPQIIRHGKFKSAIEPFVNEKMSPENKLQTRTYVNSIWNNLIIPISKSRNISIEKLNQITNNLLSRNSKTSLELGLVDKVAYHDEVMSDIKSYLNLTSDEEISFVTLKEYGEMSNSNKKYVKEKIAIIYAQGDIVSGEGSEYQIGSERIANAIRKARENEKVKAIVLRVNSPGGSALASDIIWREVVLAAKTKPIVTSMGDVAASGGYYIACATDTIIASPTTITGSIGVFGILLNNKDFYEEKIGFNFDTVKTNEMADLGADYRALTQNEKAIIQEGVEEIYDDFISKVAEGRNLSKEEVDNIGQGRVWSGENAQEIGLVDLLGGIQYSIEIAANMANLKEYRIVEYPEQKNIFDEFITDFSINIKQKILRGYLGDQYQHYYTLENILNSDEILTRLPSDIIIN